MSHAIRCLVVIAALLSLVPNGAGLALGQQSEGMSIESLRQRRSDVARRPRRIIMNNDGCDVLYFPKDQKATIEGFLAKRTTPLAGTQVGTIAFCPTSSGFSHFTHNTKVGTLLTRSGYEFGILPGTRNIAKELIDQGTDCLQAVIDFGHKHDMEVFWSMRMNDTHDVAHRPDKPYFLFPPLKEQHPDWLVGDPVKRTPFGRWSSVDYARPEIRELAFQFIEEVCRNYDIDGVELDFFRHLCYFQSTALGKTASDQERHVMTDLMRRVRTMTEAVGRDRDRPILISIRVPDSVGYCKDLGFDIERWMHESLVDILITTGYFRLNPWQYSVELGHKYGVQVYACLSDSRVRGETRFRRSSVASYRGRAMNAWADGADGLHLFNYFDPNAAIWSELGEPDLLLTMDKLYFVTVRDGDPRSYLARGRDYRNIPVFGPSHPQLLSTRRPVTLPITIGDDLVAAQDRGHRPNVSLHVEVPGIQNPKQLSVALNGVALTGGVAKDGWIDIPVPCELVKRGSNQITFSVEPSALRTGEWSVVYAGSEKPGHPWQRDPGSKNTDAEMINNSLRIADRGTSSGDYLYYRYPWGADPGGEAVVEARVKVQSGSSFIIVTNGVSGERLSLWPDHVALYHHSDQRYNMNTTDAFHLYRIELKGSDLKVTVDGQLRIDAPGALKPRSGYSRNEVAFGAANSGMTGEALWAEVKAKASGAICRDLAIRVSYETVRPESAASRFNSPREFVSSSVVFSRRFE